jgi:hypothetical protein
MPKYRQLAPLLSARTSSLAPAGRIHHVAVSSNGNVQIFDIWESAEAFEAFGAVLMPILGRLGVDMIPYSDTDYLDDEPAALRQPIERREAQGGHSR